MDGRLLDYLSRELAAGRLNLFMGAGFSAEARDADGRRLPTGPELAAELWEICFPREKRDRSKLQDLFEHALAHCREELGELIARRLRVDPGSLRKHVGLWFEMPWRRAYTLNVDDIEEAAARRFELPRKVVALSALDDDNDRACRGTASEAELEVVHLNGVVGHGVDRITFSTIQYGDRLAQHDACYRRMVQDLVEYPFVFVGTRLDEPPLWQHLRMRGSDGKSNHERERPLSFLVTPKLERARQSLLRDMNIEWIPTTAAKFAKETLARLRDTVTPGLRALRGEHSATAT